MKLVIYSVVISLAASSIGLGQTALPEGSSQARVREEQTKAFLQTPEGHYSMAGASALGAFFFYRQAFKVKSDKLATTVAEIEGLKERKAMYESGDPALVQAEKELAAARAQYSVEGLKLEKKELEDFASRINGLNDPRMIEKLREFGGTPEALIAAHESLQAEASERFAKAVVEKESAIQENLSRLRAQHQAVSRAYAKSNLGYANVSLQLEKEEAYQGRLWWREFGKSIGTKKFFFNSALGTASVVYFAYNVMWIMHKNDVAPHVANAHDYNEVLDAVRARTQANKDEKTSVHKTQTSDDDSEILFKDF